MFTQKGWQVPQEPNDLLKYKTCQYSVDNYWFKVFITEIFFSKSALISIHMYNFFFFLKHQIMINFIFISLL